MIRLFTLIIYLVTSITATYAADEVDLELVIAVDNSFSVNRNEQGIQRRGYANAFSNPALIDRIESGLYGKISVTYMEWGGPKDQVQVIPWMIIDGAESAATFAQRLRSIPVRRSNETSLANALLFADNLFPANPYTGSRKVVDISGDGPNNSGQRVAVVRDLLVSNGIVINGLPIVIEGKVEEDELDLTSYFADCVTGGQNAFTLPVRAWNGFETALLRKLTLEISGLPPVGRDVMKVGLVHRASFEASSDCLVGEKRELEDYYKLLDGITGGKHKRWRVPEEIWPTPK